MATVGVGDSQQPVKRGQLLNFVAVVLLDLKPFLPAIAAGDQTVLVQALEQVFEGIVNA